MTRCAAALLLYVKVRGRLYYARALAGVAADDGLPDSLSTRACSAIMSVSNASAAPCPKGATAFCSSGSGAVCR